MKKQVIWLFFWRITATHVITYFIAGICAFIFMNYRAHYSTETLSLLMRPIDSPWVSAGMGLQIFRGFIIALILYPFREVFLFTKNGWLKLWMLVLGLSYISTIGPTFGSFEGYIYTKVALSYHLHGIPEALLYTFLFSSFICFWYKKPLKIWNILSVILVILIMAFSALNFLSRSGILK